MQLSDNSPLQGGKYRIKGVLGSGGFGITYLGEQVALGRSVAIKEFYMKEYCNRDAATSQVSVGSHGSKETVDRFRAKFIKEAQTIAKLNHPNIIKIHDIFEENGTAYYVMEYFSGGTLSEYQQDRGALDEEKALYFIRQIADALKYIHDRKINHLDVKPGNILLNEKNDAVLIDFGLSKRYDDEGKQTSTTPVGISHGYAPLEQYKKGGVDIFSPATDIYSLGATLYKLLTGNTPPDANDVMEEGVPKLPDGVSKGTSEAVKWAMSSTRSKRPQSVEEFVAKLGGKVPKFEKNDILKDAKKRLWGEKQAKQVIHAESEETLFTDVIFQKAIYKRRSWLVNLAYICYMLWIIMWSFWSMFNSENGLVVILSVTENILLLDCIVRMWRNQKGIWYWPLALILIATGLCCYVEGGDLNDYFFLGLLYFVAHIAFLTLLLIVKKDKKSAFKLLKEGESVKLFSEFAILKQRHWIVNVVTAFVLISAVITFMGSGMLLISEYLDGINSNYVLLCLATLSGGLLYSIFIGLKNYREGLWIATAYIVSGVFFNGILPSEDRLNPIFLIGIVLCYIMQISVLFMRKNGKSAMSLMN